MKQAIFLFDYSGNMALPWAEAGHDCHCFDIKHPRQPCLGPHENITFHFWDAREPWWWVADPCFLFAFPPCTDLAGSGARWWKQKGEQAYHDAMSLVYTARELAELYGCRYGIENPVGRIPKHCPETGRPMGKWDYIFNPCDYGGYLDPPGDAYTKKTCLWTGGGFLMPAKRPIEPTEGSKMHRIAPGPRRQEIRSETPMGFARAVFCANKEASHV